MAVKSALEIVFFDESGEAMLNGCLDLPGILSKLGRDVVHF
jgi:hypothetical protein